MQQILILLSMKPYIASLWLPKPYRYKIDVKYKVYIRYM